MSGMNCPTPEQPSIDGQLICIVKLARAAGLDDGAGWIQRQATETLDRITADFEQPGDVSRTDAMKEVERLSALHAVCPSEDERCRRGHQRECDSVRFARPIRAALADAEWKLAEATRIYELPYEFILGGCRHVVTAVEGHYDGSYIVAQNMGKFDPPVKLLRMPGEALRERNEENAILVEHNATLKTQLADAENMAKEAGCHLELIRIEWRESVALLKARIEEERERANGLEFARDLLSESNTALTRKLETAREWIAEVSELLPQLGIQRFRDRGDVLLAAIDTPVELGATVESLPAECSGTDWCRLHQTDHGHPEPPEPANAQGSEAAPTWITSLGSAMEDDMDSMTPSEERAAKAAKIAAESSPPPFTVEQARQRANEHDLNARGYRQRNADSDDRTRASEHEQTAATLRHYADLLDRGDALERAAENVLDTWDGSDDLAGHIAALKNLRSVLAQRAGKVK